VRVRVQVLIVDWDVHHGNGTQNMFLKDPRVLYFSAHRYDSGTFYPGPCGSPSIVGEGAGAGKNVNVGWNHGPMGDADYLAAWRHILMPIATEFNPQLVLVSAGFDAAEGDPLGGQKITPTGYAHLTRALQELAGGRVVVVLEGGYKCVSCLCACSRAACCSCCLHV
jgi:histone deacetylase 6